MHATYLCFLRALTEPFYGNSISNLSFFAFLLSLFYTVMAKAKVGKRKAKNRIDNVIISNKILLMKICAQKGRLS